MRHPLHAETRNQDHQGATFPRLPSSPGHHLFEGNLTTRDTLEILHVRSISLESPLLLLGFESEVEKPHPPSRIRVIQQTLHTRQDRRDIISRAPAILQDIQTQFAIGVDVGVEHLGDEADRGGFGRVGVGECEGEAEGAVFEGCVG